MTERKSILLLASAAALTLAVHEGALSVPPGDEPAPSTASATVTPAPAPIVEKSIEKSATAGKSTPTPAGGALSPPSEQDAAPPRVSRPETRRGMTLEERRAQWEQRFRKMRERAMQRRQEMQASMERWDSYWKTFDAMTPEQKEAVYAIFGSGHKRCAHHAKGHGCSSPRRSARPHSGQPKFGRPAGPAFPGPDYGYDPRRAQPSPFERNPAAVPIPPRGVRPGE